MDALKALRTFAPIVGSIASLLFSSGAHAGSFVSRSQAQRIAGAVGTLEVFPYADKKKTFRCTAFHIGGGVMATAGHCFLGASACNGARFVSNAQSAWPFPRAAQCTEILASVSDTLRTGSRGDDTAYFKVSPVPSDFIDVAFNATLPQNTQNVEPDVRYFSVEGRWKHPSPHSHTGRVDCAGARVVNEDFFGRPRPLAVVETHCGHSGFNHGAPVFDPGSGNVVGVVLGDFRTPTRADVRTHFTSLTEPKALKNLSFTHIGWFAPEAFPRGLDGGLDFVARRFEGSGSISLAVTQGLLTEVTVEQPDGVSTQFRGAPSFDSVRPRHYELPLTVRVRTLAGASSVQMSLLVSDDSDEKDSRTDTGP